MKTLQSKDISAKVASDAIHLTEIYLLHKGQMKISKIFINRLLVMQQELRILKNSGFLDFANLQKIDEVFALHGFNTPKAYFNILRQSTFHSSNSSEGFILLGGNWLEK